MILEKTHDDFYRSCYLKYYSFPCADLVNIVTLDKFSIELFCFFNNFC